MSDLLIKNMGIPKDKPIGVVIHPSGRVEVPDSFEASFSYPRVVGVNLLRAHEITDHGDLCDKDKLREATKNTEVRNSRGEIYLIGKVIAKMIDEASTILEAST